MRQNRTGLLQRLPEGTEVHVKGDEAPLHIKNDSLATDDQRRVWLKTTLNQFVNVLRPELRKWFEESQK